MAKSTTPPERTLTPRQAVLAVLTGAPMTALEISGQAGLSEKDVYDHLAHLLRSKGNRISVEPAKCMACGYRFVKRDKLTKPGRCPECRGRRIAPAGFYLK